MADESLMFIAAREGSSHTPTPVSHFLFRRALIISVASLLGSVVAVVANAFSPNEILFAMAQLLSAIFAVSTAFASYFGIARLWRSRPELRKPIVFLAILTSGTFLAHLYIINLPPTDKCYIPRSQVYGCIMDEIFYVPAAHSLLAGIKCSSSSPVVCDSKITAVETSANVDHTTPILWHPPLVYALIAAGIEIFQFGDLGWRIFPAILGTLCIPLIFAITYLMSRGIKFAYCAALLLAFDTLFFVHSSIAVLDVPPTFFAMVGFLLYVWGRGFWKFDSLVLSGAFFGLAGLSKETAAFLLAALLMYHTAFFRGEVKGLALSLAKIVVPAGLVFALGLQVYDSLYAGAVFPTFVQHIEFWLPGAQYSTVPWIDTRVDAFITPLNWLTFYEPPIYLVYLTGAVGYYGVTNMLMVWMVFSWVPLVIYQSVRGKKSKLFPLERDGDLKAGVFALIWFLWGYLPYILLWLHGRVTFPFYILPAVPALALGAAYFVTREWFPTKLTSVYITANFAWFFVFFPDKTFLPVWVRALIGW